MSAIVVCSGKGSPGATFVSVNLAAGLARAGEEVLLLDLDPAGGDLCSYLGLDPRQGLYPLLRMEGSLSGSARLLAEAEERSGFLGVCGFPEPSDLASADVLAEALAAGRKSGRTVIADIGRVCKTNAPLAAEGELVILVVRADLVSVLGAQRALRQLEAAGAHRERSQRSCPATSGADPPISSRSGRPCGCRSSERCPLTGAGHVGPSSPRPPPAEGNSEEPSTPFRLASGGLSKRPRGSRKPGCPN